MSFNLPSPLIQALRDKKCILFAGSGLSAMAGYPTWSELVETLVREARRAPYAPTRGIQQYEREKDYLTLAEFARSALGTTQYSIILREQFERQVTPTLAHRTIALTEYRGLVTTNFDRVLETAFTQERNWAPVAFTSDSVSSMATALYNPDFFIYKLHGDISSPQSIVLTSRDYDQLILRSPHVRSFLQAIFLNYTVLFVGYSLRDPDFQLILRELTLIFEGYVPPHYALLANAAEFTVEHLMTRMNIQTISYSPQEKHKELVKILETLRGEASYKPYTIRSKKTLVAAESKRKYS